MFKIYCLLSQILNYYGPPFALNCWPQIENSLSRKVPERLACSNPVCLGSNRARDI
jgi:hypothetical protein